jgi:hypothetical protein
MALDVHFRPPYLILDEWPVCISQLRGPHIKFFSKIDIFQGRASPSLGLVNRYMKYNKGNEQSRRRLCSTIGIGMSTRRAVRHERGGFEYRPFVVGPYHSSLGRTLRRSGRRRCRSCYCCVRCRRRQQLLLLRSSSLSSAAADAAFVVVVVGCYPSSSGVSLRRGC